MARVFRIMRRGALWLVGGLVTLVLLLALGIGGLIWYLTDRGPQIDGEIRLPGLERPTGIYRDGDGVPHIFAASEHDAYMALGYVHAQDRMLQMDFLRRLARGRLSEIAGPLTLEFDRAMRTLGLARQAEASLTGLDPATLAVAEAYAAGVNAWLTGRPEPLPIEFQLLAYSPDPWQPADSLLWGRLMALNLNGNWRGTALRTRLAARLGVAAVRGLFPMPEQPRIDDRAAAAPSPQTAELLGATAAAIPATGPVRASNAWAVDGRLTASGHPILAGDPHLGFSVPGTWYLARIVAPGLNVAGATVPGVPFHILGHNGHLAWSLTTTGASAQDLVVETLDAADPGRYLTPDGPQPFTLRAETIQVRFAGAKPLTVRETRHGPVISDVVPGLAPAAGGQVIALAATALRPQDSTPDAFHRLNRATSRSDAVTALAAMRAPVQNVFLADRAGIGFVVAGAVPIRESGDGFLPADGATSKTLWTGEIPYAALPRDLEPVRGMLVNANNRVSGADPSLVIGQDFDSPLRAERIAARLREKGGGQDLGFHAQVQMDARSLLARRLIPHLTAAPAPDLLQPIIAALAAWDGEMDRDRPEPLIFATWQRELLRGLFAERMGPLFGEFWFGGHPELLQTVLKGGTSWCDTTEGPRDCRRLMIEALDRTMRDLGGQFGRTWQKWRWGQSHQVEFGHPLFGKIPLIGRLTGLRIDTDGGNDTINRGAFSLSRSPLTHMHGASFRAVYDLADLENSRFVVAPGQSGNPLSPHYGDFLRRWRDGASRTLSGTPGELRDGGAKLLNLIPQ